MVRLVLFQPSLYDEQRFDVPGNWDSILTLLFLLPNISTLMLPIFEIGTTYKLGFLPYAFEASNSDCVSAFSLRQPRNVEVIVSRYEQLSALGSV